MDRNKCPKVDSDFLKNFGFFVLLDNLKIAYFSIFPFLTPCPLSCEYI